MHFSFNQYTTFCTFMLIEHLFQETPPINIPHLTNASFKPCIYPQTSLTSQMPLPSHVHSPIHIFHPISRLFLPQMFPSWIFTSKVLPEKKKNGDQGRTREEEILSNQKGRKSAQITCSPSSKTNAKKENSHQRRNHSKQNPVQKPHLPPFPHTPSINGMYKCYNIGRDYS